MRKKACLITGAAGEIGQALIKGLAGRTSTQIVTIDLQPLPETLRSTTVHIQGDIMDKALLSRLISEYEFEAIYHLAAMLSTRAEFSPEIGPPGQRRRHPGAAAASCRAVRVAQRACAFYLPKLHCSLWHA